MSINEKNDLIAKGSWPALADPKVVFPSVFTPASSIHVYSLVAACADPRFSDGTAQRTGTIGYNEPIHMTVSLSKRKIPEFCRRATSVRRVLDRADRQLRGKTTALTQNNRIERIDHA
jgi:hypothetical protein